MSLVRWVVGCALGTLIGVTPAAGQSPAPDPSAHGNHGRMGAAPAIEQPDPIAPVINGWTVEDLQALALENNPTLAQARAHVTMARGRRLQSGLLPNPNVGYAASEIGDNGSAGQQGGFVEQVIPTGGKLSLNRAAFAHEENQERWATEVQSLIVQNSVQIAFYETLVAQEVVRVREQLNAIAEEGVRTTEQLLNVGQADRPDLLAVRVDSRKAKITLANATIHYQQKWRQLTALVGVPELELRPLAGELVGANEPLDGDATLDYILRNSPELQIAYAGVSRARAGLSRARVEPIPNLFTQAGVQRDTNTGNTIGGIQVGVNLPIFDRNQGNILTSQGELRHACEEVHRIELVLRSRFAETWGRYATARRTIDEYQLILSDAQEAYQLNLQAFQRRAAAFPQVLISQRSYFEAQGDYYAALVDLRRAEVELNGFLLVDGLSQPEPHGATSPEQPGLPVRVGR